MPDKNPNTGTIEAEKNKLSLEKAFNVFLEQSTKLEQSHNELKEKLREAQLDLADKNRELALKISEIGRIKEKLSGILESITDAVFLIDSEDKVDIANKAAIDILNTVTDEKKTILDMPEIAGYLKTHDAIKDADIEISVAKETRYYMLSVIPMSRDENNLKYRVVSLKDVTEKRNLQRKVSRESRMSALGKVAASVAHEIRNPLGAIEGFAMLLERDLKDNPASLKLASRTVYAARQLNSVVSNLLNYTRELRPSLYPHDINAIITEAIDFIRPMAEDRKITLEIELEEKPLTAAIDTVQFRQVITNLVTNAIDECTVIENGRIKIRSYYDETHIFIEISDNGPGIAENKKKQIFEPFFTMKEGGIGLGLALCQRIMDLHDGEITETGIEGKGACFIIKLKKAEA
ncbi:MAG: hypothetical protein A2017_09735 [Lentisphaerae bacterium GWF2_44_16]|nr:MAG: hypothetical protein A2017_09735 [Lentisphaerae bacterium GWF2_44_16]